MGPFIVYQFSFRGAFDTVKVKLFYVLFSDWSEARIVRWAQLEQAININCLFALCRVQNYFLRVQISVGICSNILKII